MSSAASRSVTTQSSCVSLSAKRRPSNQGLEAQAERVRDGQLDLAAFVMNENAELIRALANKYDLEMSLPPTSKAWLRETSGCASAESPPAFTNAKPIPATDKLVAQVDTLIMRTRACTARSE